ncbi:MAG: HD domain-containing protein [Acidobacteria bacterium]|nr:HD domain-containing protein [Acidobacteriota bacterium]
MAAKKINTFEVIGSRFPGLMDEIRKTIQDSEKAYDRVGSRSDSFLWEHTMHVASIADRLAQSERVDPVLSVAAALFHDAGKFVGGQYHEEGTIEEEESARIAERLLRQHGMKEADIRKVLSGLRALYNENIRKNRIAAILHDADFLSKFGAMGVASFFAKSTLRGRTLRSTVLGHLSKELTYAACLPLSMHTATGKKMAGQKAKDTLRFFHSLLSELREAQVADLEIRRLRISNPASGHRLLAIHLVVSPACPECGKGWSMKWATEKGIKCNKLNVDWNCSHCGEQIETSFCLPEIA